MDEDWGGGEEGTEGGEGQEKTAVHQYCHVEKYVQENAESFPQN